MKRAYKIPGLKIVFGSDAVAGAHGRNAEEFVDRVPDVGVDAMTAMVSANSLAAEAMGLSEQIGSISAGLQADIIALDGDPAEGHHRSAASWVRDEGRSGATRTMFAPAFLTARHCEISRWR